MVVETHQSLSKEDSRRADINSSPSRRGAVGNSGPVVSSPSQQQHHDGWGETEKNGQQTGVGHVTPTPSSDRWDESQEDYHTSCSGNTGVQLEEELQQQQQDIPVYDKFDDMGLSEGVLRGIYGYGLENPSVIQKKAIVPMSKGRDVLMHAQSGTGKTAAFTTGMLERLDTSAEEIQAIILSPTRDLAKQTHRVVLALGDYINIRSHLSIGQQDLRTDIAGLRTFPHVVTGTPGRILGNMSKGHLCTRNLKILVLDEVDVMLSEGFRDQVADIIAMVPQDTQVVVASATYNEDVHRIASKIQRDPVKIVLLKEEVSLAGIKQFYIDCECSSRDVDRVKLSILFDLYQRLHLNQTIIFVNSRRKAMWLADEMDHEDHTVSVIHGEMTQAERDQTLREFINGASRVLVATDIVARGIDVQTVSVVINFDLCNDRANYMHRIGRGGRFGRKSIAVNLLTSLDRRDVANIRGLEEYYNIIIDEMPQDVLQYIS